jgi:hypothetical protein
MGLLVCVLVGQDDAGNVMSQAVFNFELMSVYNITVTATDPSGLNTTAVVSVYITDENDSPSLTLSLLTISENQDVGMSVTGAVIGEDEDEAAFVRAGFNSRLHYFLEPADPNFVGDLPFIIDTLTGVISTTASLDFEAVTEYAVIVSVSDPMVTVSLAAIISVLDINDSPVIAGCNASLPEPCFTYTIVENSVNGSGLLGPMLTVTDQVLAVRGPVARNGFTFTSTG